MTAFLNQLKMLTAVVGSIGFIIAAQTVVSPLSPQTRSPGINLDAPTLTGDCGLEPDWRTTAYAVLYAAEVCFNVTGEHGTVYTGLIISGAS
jgi:hypothetical protein